jgi:hypothetical protein
MHALKQRILFDNMHNPSLISTSLEDNSMLGLVYVCAGWHRVVD